MKSKWFVVPRPNAQARIRLFCFPYAAGNASTYTSWWQWLPHEVELRAVQPPGRASRIEEPAYQSMEAMVDGVCTALRPWLDKPYVVFGHSLGSRVGFEYIHRASAAGWRLPELFIASGSSAPHVAREHKKISHLPDAEFVQALRRFDGPTDRLLEDEQLVALFMPVFRADFNIADTYYRERGTLLHCPAAVFGGDRDEDARPDELDSWQAHFSQPIGINLFEGDHFFVESNSQRVASRVGELVGDVLGKMAGAEDSAMCRSPGTGAW